MQLIVRRLSNLSNFAINLSRPRKCLSVDKINFWVFLRLLKIENFFYYEQSIQITLVGADLYHRFYVIGQFSITQILTSESHSIA